MDGEDVLSGFQIPRGAQLFEVPDSGVEPYPFSFLNQPSGSAKPDRQRARACRYKHVCRVAPVLSGELPRLRDLPAEF